VRRKLDTAQVSQYPRPVLCVEVTQQLVVPLSSVVEEENGAVGNEQHFAGGFHPDPSTR